MPRWRLSVALILVGQAITFVTLFFSQSFLPFFLQDELGISDPTSLAWWVGISTAAAPVLLVVFNPLWGVMADRVGQKPMLLRALFGSGVFLAAPALVINAWQFLGTRLMMGVFSGVSAASIGLISMVTPREHLASSLGLAQTARIIGATLGPAVGGAMADAIGYRGAFVVAGAVTIGLAIAALVVLPNPPPVVSKGNEQGMRARIRYVAGQPRLRALMLFALLIQVSDLTVVPYLPVLVGSMSTSRENVASQAGLVLSAGALSMGLAGLTIGRLTRRRGYRVLLVGACGAGTLLQLANVLADSTDQLLWLRLAMGLAFGSLLPLSNALLGLATPVEHRGLVFGLASTAAPAAALVGPLLGSIAAVAFGLRAPFVVAAMLLALAGVLAVRSIREPDSL